MSLAARLVFTSALLFASFAYANDADISNPLSLMFVGDRQENLIDVISLKDNDVVYRIETSIHPDHIVVSPFAPILVYADNRKAKQSTCLWFRATW